MKTNKIIKAGLSATAILALTVSWAYAMGQGGGQGLSQYVTAEEKAKMQSLSWDERTEYMNELKAKYNVSGGQGQWNGQGKWKGQWGGQGQAKQSGHNEDPEDMIKDIPMSDVSDIEKELLINQYGEERMARDLYTYASEKYPNVNTFGNIKDSEQKHMDTLKVLLDRYDIDAPSDYAKDNDLYVTLKNKIDLSEKDAIEVGLMVEMVDIDNIAEDIRNTDNDDFKIILTNIWWASYNHLRGFVNALQNNNYTTDLEWTKYISQEEVDTKGGWLKVKLAEKLEAEWVSLPETASSKYISENCNEDNTEWHWNHWNSNSKKVQKGKNSSNSEKYSQMEIKKEQYKKAIQSKYSDAIEKIKADEEKTQALLIKIDDLIEQTQNSAKSEETKIKYIAILTALSELLK